MHPPDNAALDSLREIGPGLSQLAKAVDRAPAAFGSELQAAHDRLVATAGIILALGVVIGFILGRLWREDA